MMCVLAGLVLTWSDVCVGRVLFTLWGAVGISAPVFAPGAAGESLAWHHD